MRVVMVAGCGLGRGKGVGDGAGGEVGGGSVRGEEGRGVAGVGAAASGVSGRGWAGIRSGRVRGDGKRGGVGRPLDAPVEGDAGMGDSWDWEGADGRARSVRCGRGVVSCESGVAEGACVTGVGTGGSEDGVKGRRCGPSDPDELG